jgi:GNAT superfamily N-acetyltransferase
MTAAALRSTPEMTCLEIRPFEPGHLDDAARLLAARHAAQRSHEPSLPVAFEATDAARAAVEELLTPEASGTLATRGGAVVGFLLGTPRADTSWGPNVWVEGAGHAVERAEDVRDLYARAAARWVEEGRTSHYAIVPATDAGLVDAWFRLGFGQQHVHAVREAPPQPLTELPDGVEIRRPTRDDIDALTELELALPFHQQASPVFSPLPPPPFEEARAEWEEDFDNPIFATFVAVTDGRVVGSAVGCPITVSGMHKGILCPDEAGFLGFAAVLPEARGAGIGKALGTTVLDWAAAEGYAAVVTDWRATNLLSSRTWPQLGWRPTFYRLHRAIT